MAHEKPLAVYGALVANLLIAAVKFGAAAVTGSSAMLAEAVHSVVDTGNQVLLLVGHHQSRLPPDDQHPFGHGAAVYFYGMLVAMLLFGIGGGLSIYEGIEHLRHPPALSDPMWNYIVLGAAAVFETISLLVALRELRAEAPGGSFWERFHGSKNPAVFAVVAEDLAAVAGLLLAFAGVFLAHTLAIPALDGCASIAVGLLLCGVAVLLAHETRGLLLGESAAPEVRQRIAALVRADPAVLSADPPLTMHLAPGEVLLNMSVRFDAGLTVGELAAAIRRLEEQVRREDPRITRMFFEAEAFVPQPRQPPEPHS